MSVKLPSFIESFRELISIPSVSSIDPAWDQSNRQVVELLANWFAELGFAVDLLDVDESSGKLNLIACIGQGSDGLVLSGHTDTVPYTESAWQQSPFKLTERDNRLYGLGTADMKGFFPIILEVLCEMELDKLKRPLFILATCDEESTMSGAKALVNAKRPLGRHALIGEPTGLKPINMHKGVMLETIKLVGKAGHSSDPALGVNALEGMHTVIDELMRWRGKLQAEYQNSAFKVPVPTMNFGSIHGGDNANRICADCELSIDLRLLPRMHTQEIRADLRKRVSQSIEGSGLKIEFDSIFPGTSPMETDADAEIVKVAEQLSGINTGTVAFGTEGPYLNSLGMQTVVLGPGDIDQAHQANEYLCLDRIRPMQKIIKNMIHHFCM